jgi:hypothetical protein
MRSERARYFLVAGQGEDGIIGNPRSFVKFLCTIGAMIMLKPGKSPLV